MYVDRQVKASGKGTNHKKFELEYQKVVEKAIGILIECGGDINKKDNMEQTPIL